MDATPPSNKWMSNLQIGNRFSDTTNPKTWADLPVDFWVSLPTDEWWQACINTMQLDTTVHDLIGLCRDMTTSVNTQNQDEARPGHQLRVKGEKHSIWFCCKQHREGEEDDKRASPIKRLAANQDKKDMLCECVVRGMNQEWFLERLKHTTIDELFIEGDRASTLMNQWASTYNARTTPAFRLFSKGLDDCKSSL